MTLLSIENLGVCYPLRTSRERSLRRRLLALLTGEEPSEPFWALRDVSLDMHEGETLGIIGPNGAGKSTLCMTLAGVLSPDEGAIRSRGRVSLLSGLGVGFNNEMTGRENIRLTGALMGLSHDAIAARLPEIVEFAGLEEFIDRPVRTYSSGMNARLAFSIATAGEPDILLVDETLGVGDAAFRARCEERMRSFMARARGIVLVSHSMETIRRLCDRVAWLRRGRLVAVGRTHTIVDRYLRSVANAGPTRKPEAPGLRLEA